MKKLLVLLALLSFPLPALAQRVGQLPTVAPASNISTRIAAVVNDNVITTTDLDQRMRLAILSSGLPDNAEVRAHLLPQILRGLIDEQLEAQEAKRLDLSVSKEEIDEALAHIAKDNNIQGSMLDFVAAHGASADALTNEIRDSLLWSKVVQRELRPNIEIGDDEIDAVIDRIRADAGKEEFLVSEILLTVDNPKDEDQVRQTAENLVAQLKSGANFSAIARQFSQGAGAAQGGDMGWIQQGQLSPELNRALAAASPGEISDPIRTSNGFHILAVRDKRTVSLGDPAKASINLMQAFRAYANGDKDKAMQEAARLRASFKGCASLNDTLASFPGWKAQKLGDMNPAKAPEWLASKVQGVAVGGSSEPLATDKGAAVLFVCSRDESGINRDAIMHSIGTEKLELQARRLLRDLHRNAYLDVRLGKDS
ncbi:MAG: peptidylprolyl isomerase [Alphaproteobacteria bacterium]|nr:peptidylprolyl isomerase [Alphaproteobacteria bacterium]